VLTTITALLQPITAAIATTEQAEHRATTLEACVRGEVWCALLQRYNYAQVTDMLRVMRAARVIEKAVQRLRRRKWARKFARIDPDILAKVTRHSLSYFVFFFLF
jgi:hypothetical protein